MEINCDQNLTNLKELARARNILFSEKISKRDLCDLINASHEPKLQRQFGPPNVSDQFILEKQLGQGKFGQVWLAAEKSTGKLFALKFLKNDMSAKDKDEVMREVSVLSMLAKKEKCHQNIVCYYRNFAAVAKLGKEKQKYYNLIIQTEFIEGVELGKWRDTWYATKKTVPPKKTIRSIAIGLLRGLEFAHNKGIYHLDVKPSNVMIRNADGQAVLIDFGLACAEHGGKDASCETAIGFGTPGYMSPEYVEHCLNNPESGKCNAMMREKTDVWAAGMTLLALVLEQDVGALLQTKYENDVAPKIKAGQVVREEKQFVQDVKDVREHFPEAPAPIYKADAAVSSVIEQALTIDMKKRPSAAKLLKLLE